MISLIGDTHGFMITCPECDWRLVEYIPEIMPEDVKSDIKAHLEVEFTREYYWHYGSTHLDKPTFIQDKVPVDIPHFPKR